MEKSAKDQAEAALQRRCGRIGLPGAGGVRMCMCMMCVVVGQVQGSVGVGVAQLTCSLQRSSQLAPTVITWAAVAASDEATLSLQVIHGRIMGREV